MLLTIVCAAPVHAQDSEEERTAAARALFEEGMELVREGALDEATDRLRRSLELRASAVVAFNLSTALVERGQLVEASEHLRRIARDESAPARVREAAEAQLEAVLPRIGRLTVRLEGPSEGVEVRVDDAVLAEALIGVAQPIDPGAHTVAALRGGEEVAQGEVDVEAGGRAEVSLTIPPLPLVAAIALPTPEVEVERALRLSVAPAESSIDPGEVVLWTSVGVLAAAAVLATVLAVTLSGPEPIPGDFEPPFVRVGR